MTNTKSTNLINYFFVIAKKMYKTIAVKINTQPTGIKKNGSFKIPSLSTDEPANSKAIKQIIPMQRIKVATLNFLSIQSAKFHNFKLINILHLIMFLRMIFQMLIIHLPNTQKKFQSLMSQNLSLSSWMVLKLHL